MKSLIFVALLVVSSISHSSAFDDAIYAPMHLVPDEWGHRDKWAHALVGGFVYTNVRMAYGHREAFGAVLILAIAKEVYDARHGRPFNPWDIAASLSVPLTASLVWEF